MLMFDKSFKKKVNVEIFQLDKKAKKKIKNSNHVQIFFYTTYLNL
jgi:hypothetical protein